MFFDFLKREDRPLSEILGVDLVKEPLAERDFKRIKLMNFGIKLTHIFFIIPILGLLYGIIFDYDYFLKFYGLSFLVILLTSYLVFFLIFKVIKVQSEKGIYNSARRIRIGLGDYSLLSILTWKFFPYFGVLLSLVVFLLSKSERDRKISGTMLALSITFTTYFFS